MRKSIVIGSVIGIGASLFYLITRDLRRDQSAALVDDAGDLPDRLEKSSRAATPESQAATFATAAGPQSESLIIDDQGTDQIEAANILRNIRDSAFDSSDEKLALALGRPAEEINEWTSGSGIIDGDVVLKARTLAIQRGIKIE